jgi:hypothetical protein
MPSLHWRTLQRHLGRVRIGQPEGAIFLAVAKGGKISGSRLSSKSVANVVKRHALALGLDPRAFAGRSLRAGFLTSAAARGASVFKMMDVSRHKSVDTLRSYVRAQSA